jgi:hypothetical protein
MPATSAPFAICGDVEDGLIVDRQFGLNLQRLMQHFRCRQNAHRRQASGTGGCPHKARWMGEVIHSTGISNQIPMSLVW